MRNHFFGRFIDYELSAPAKAVEFAAPLTQWFAKSKAGAVSIKGLNFLGREAAKSVILGLHRNVELLGGRKLRDLKDQRAADTAYILQVKVEAAVRFAADRAVVFLR